MSPNIKIDVGCGFKKQQGYIGVDTRRTYTFPNGVTKKTQADIIASATALPFKTHSATTVYSSRCIQHVANDVRAFKEIKRVLKPNCKATVILACWRGRLYYRLKWLHKTKPYPLFHLYTKKRLHKKISNAKITYTKGFLHRNFIVTF